jgi:hypothetical protein
MIMPNQPNEIQLNKLTAKYWPYEGKNLDEFKAIMAKEYGYAYDPERQSFYNMSEGKKKFIPWKHLNLLAAFHGYSGPL